MNKESVGRIAQELNRPLQSVEAVLSLLEDGCTIPFIARYRKEATGSLDEETVQTIQERYGRLEESKREGKPF